MDIEEETARVIEENAVVPEADARQVATALSPLLSRVRAEALREAVEAIQARRIEIYNAQIEANKGYLPVVPGAVIGGYQQAEQIALDLADRIEKERAGA